MKISLVFSVILGLLFVVLFVFAAEISAKVREKVKKQPEKQQICTGFVWKPTTSNTQLSITNLKELEIQAQMRQLQKRILEQKRAKLLKSQLQEEKN